MSEQITLFQQDAIVDPDVIDKVGVTKHFNVDNRFRNHILNKDYYIFTEFSDLFLAAEAHRLENEWHQKYRSSIYDFTLALQETEEIDGITEMRAFAKPIRNKIVPDFMKKRKQFGWAAQTKMLKERYFMDSNGNWDESLNKNPDPFAEYPYYCYKLYVVVFAKKGTKAGEEIKKRKEKALEEKRNLQAANQ